MRLCKMCCFVLLLPLFLLTNFLNGSINAAALSGGRYMTPQEALQVFGNSIDFEYFNGTDYTTAQFLYDSTDIVYNNYGSMPDYWSDFSGATYLRYTASTVNLSTNPQYITVDIAPSYSIFNTDQITTLIALSTGSDSYSVSSSFQSPSWDWVIGSESYHYENDLLYNSYHSCLRFSNNYLATFVPMQWFSQSSSSGYSRRAVFSGNSGSTLYLWICCPYISQSAEGSQGTFTTTSQSDIIVNVDVDLTETNGILSAIQGVLSGIVDGVKGLFIPSQNALSTFVNAVDTLLHETFGIFYDNETLIHSALTQLLTGSAQESIYFEGFTMSLAGTSFTFPSFNVPLKPDNAHMSLLYTALASAIDIVCTLAFINMLKHKIWAVFMGEKIVEVEELDDAD